MHIGIDARMYGTKHRGIGRYVASLIDGLARAHTKHRFTIFTSKESVGSIPKAGGRFRIVETEVPWYSAQEQFAMPKIVQNARVGAMHWPHLNVPYFCPVPYVVTIHDLIVFHFPSSRATGLPKWQYCLKLKGYDIVLRRAVAKAKAIIAVSAFTRRDIVRHLGVDEEKITVTHLGVDRMILGTDTLKNSSQYNKNLTKMFGIAKPYLLYVGSAYPHKNLTSLLRAFYELRTRYRRNWQLVLAGRDDRFYQQLRQFVEKTIPDEQIRKDIIFTGQVDEAQLDGLYRSAKLFVFPSLYEGFGLPPLEAMSRGVPVVASNRSSLPEVLSDAASYCNPEDINSIAGAIDSIGGNAALQQEFSKKGIARAQRFSWDKTIQQTLGVYRKLEE